MAGDNTSSTARPSTGDPLDTDFTLPSVVPAIVAASRGRYARQALILTIAFHPDTDRIGEVARVPEHDPKTPFVLGRRSPSFSATGEGVGQPLQDPHVSRRAVVLEFDGQKLALHRFSGSSRLRLGDLQLLEDTAVSEEELRRGVPVLLGHAVVLVLRLVELGTEEDASAPAFHELQGSGPAMRRLRKQISVAAACADDVLIRGETGTGKELVATAIHRASARAAAPMVSVNMAALPTDLAPALLFGSARGAYTGAERNAQGFFEQADGGTLFLDEIGDTPVPVQAQILRALQQREIQVVGGRIRPVNVRVISATDAPLEEDIAHFKAALRHRLGGHEISLLPLREHPEDIGELVWHFAREAVFEQGAESILPSVSSSAIDLAGWAFTVYQALRYDWPGNIRQLRNVVRQMVLSSPRAMALPEHFEQQVARRRDAVPESVAESGGAEPPRRLADVDDEAFAQAMTSCDFEPARVARELRVSRTAVYRRIESSRQFQLASELPDQAILDALSACAGDDAAAAKLLAVSVGGLRQRLRLLERHR